MTISFLRSKLLLDAGFSVHGFTTRAGGVSEGPWASLNLGFDVGDADENVKANWTRLKEAIGTDLPLCRVRQVHGARTADAKDALLSAWDARPNIEADAMVSTGNMVKAVQTADCVPGLLACTETRVAAAVHAGWRGASGGVVRNAIRKMVSLGAEPGRIIAALGPCIGYPCYEVGEEVATKLVESADPKPKEAGTYLLDLANAVEVDLIVGGVSTDRIERVGGCTHCNEADFFSYRKSGGTCGRTAAFIV
jgi:polyphenol oxidase